MFLSEDEREYINNDFKQERVGMNAPLEPTVGEPAMEELYEYLEDGICETTDGCYVEPDGHCEHGHPSWMLYLGYI